jgi:holo-[acyl-carrier protein] synthase
MEIVSIGTDIVEVPRIARLLREHGETFLRRVYTSWEIHYCQEHRHAAERFAGRWAAKEAILKCLGTGWSQGLCWTDLEIRNDPQGVPQVHLRGAARARALGLQVTDILLSLSHCRTYAVATAVAVRGASRRDDFLGAT